MRVSQEGWAWSGAALHLSCPARGLQVASLCELARLGRAPRKAPGGTRSGPFPVLPAPLAAVGSLTSLRRPVRGQGPPSGATPCP